MATRKISIDEFPTKAERQPLDACGPAPQMAWIDIDKLVVDESYQREITRQGRANVLRIAAAFRWSYFSCVVVAPLAGGRYAIVDGQHRTTAAALVGHAQVPCQIIQADPREQAQAFTAVNSAVTRMNILGLHRAAVAAGDKDAVALQQIASEAGVRILPYPVPELKQKPGETMALGAMRDMRAQVGRAALVLGLRAIVETPKNNVAGGVTAAIVKACAQVASEWRVRGGDAASFIAAIGNVVLIREAEKAARSERPKNTGVHQELTNRLRKAIGLAGTTAVPGRAA